MFFFVLPKKNLMGNLTNTKLLRKGNTFVNKYKEIKIKDKYHL